MKRNKGYPYREKKKQKTKIREDRRPHVSIRMPLRGWVRREELTELVGDNGFKIPDLQYIENRGRQNWSRQEVHTLIDEYARIAWSRKSGYRREMSRLAGYFLRLWDDQQGLCALTKLPLLGTPAMKSYGIGIDLLRKKLGPKKGNIRLVSCPIAMTRFLHPTIANQRMLKPIRKNFGEFDVNYAIAHVLFWYVEKHLPFKHSPVLIDFPFGKTESHGNNFRSWSSWYNTKSDIIAEFAYTIGLPSDATWKHLNLDKSRFLKVKVKDDIVHLEGTDNSVDKKLPLSNPHIDLEKEICDAAKFAFERGFHIKLRAASRTY